MQLKITLTWKHLQRRTLLKMTNTKKLSSTSSTEHKIDMNINKINKYKKLNSTSTTEQKTEHNCTSVKQTINIHKSNKGVTNLKTPHEKG